MVIDREFKELLRELNNEEYEALEKSIKLYGCRDPLVAWNDTLIDGHNRYEICEKNNIPYKTVKLDFSSKEEACLWILDNQDAGRNLSEADKIETALKKKHYLSEIGRNKMIEGGRNGGKKALSIIDKGSHNTQKTVSKDLGMSTGKLAMAEKVMKNLDLWEKVRSEELTVGGAYKELRKQEVKTEKKIKHEEERANISKEIIPFSGTYDLILSDPPWRYDFSETESRKIENQYETADVPEIEKHIPPSNDNCILLLWATAPKLQEAFTVMKAWGFEYKTCAVWDKVNIGMGYWFRGQHEILLVGTKGKVSPPADFLRVSSVFTEKRTKHSKKPECVYKWIEDTFPSLKKLEMYCRTPRAGWSVWGNEV